MTRNSDLGIGWIGFGQVATAFCEGFRKHDAALPLAAYDIAWDDKRRARAEQLNVRIVPSVQELVAQSDLVVCAVVVQTARDAAASAARFLQPAQLYVDLTSIGPARAGEIAQIVGATGAQFAKLALMGAVAAFGYKVPSVASGCGARRLADSLAPLGVQVQVLNDDPAAAATLKLCRSLFQKGIVALALEALLVAKKNGVEKEVIASLAETWNEEKFDRALNRLLCSSALSAKRRAAELEEAIAAFGELGMPLPVARANRETFRALEDLQARDVFGGKEPEDFEKVLEAIG